MAITQEWNRIKRPDKKESEEEKKTKLMMHKGHRKEPKKLKAAESARQTNTNTQEIRWWK